MVNFKENRALGTLVPLRSLKRVNPLAYRSKVAIVSIIVIFITRKYALDPTYVIVKKRIKVVDAL